MLNKEVEHKIFGKCWKMFNTVRKNPTDTGWEKCVNEAHEISELIAEYKKFHEKLVLATIEEAETEEKNKNAKEKSDSYKNAGAAFNAAWEMFARFIEIQTNLKNPELISWRNTIKHILDALRRNLGLQFTKSCVQKIIAKVLL